MDIKESDWKSFRRLRELALDRYCQRVLDEVRIIVEESGDTNHKRYLALWKLLQDKDETIAVAFNDPRRSNAVIQLKNILAQGLLTDAEINQFSEDLRERIDGV